MIFNLMINSVVCGDCLEVMKSIPDKAIDMILCDLPYGTTACKWDTIIPFEPLWKEYKRIIKDNGAIVLTASQPFTSALVMSQPEMFRYELIWHKNRSGGFITAKKMPMKYHENILIFYKQLPKYNPQFVEYADSVKKRFKVSGVVPPQTIIKNNIQNIKSVPGFVNYERGKYPESVLKIAGVKNSRSEHLHPTEKPVALFEYLIRTYTNEGDLVLDNCAGSGTTGIACLNTKRNFILIEKEEKYIDLMTKRIAETCKLKQLF
jgi:site-specific DNA-methyltransferase (adenine-specific)